MRATRLRVAWEGARGGVLAVEPTSDDVRARAAELAGAYNEPHNGAMMGNTIVFSEGDVVLHYEAMAEEGARQLFLFDGASFAGDADLRNIANGAAEMAILVASRGSQGRGLGTRFAILLHALAFRALALERVYVTILPENVASRRLFERIGHTVDTSPRARAYADDERDVSMSIGKREFERAHATALAEIRIGVAEE